jgi:hypothetical protein
MHLILPDKLLLIKKEIKKTKNQSNRSLTQMPSPGGVPLDVSVLNKLLGIERFCF